MDLRATRAYLELATAVVLLAQAALCIVQVRRQNLFVAPQLLCSFQGCGCLCLRVAFALANLRDAHEAFNPPSLPRALERTGCQKEQHVECAISCHWCLREPTLTLRPLNVNYSNTTIKSSRA